MTRKTLVLALILCSLPVTWGQEQPSASIIPLKPWILHAKLIHEILPEYPAGARANHIQGNVYMNVLVDEKGRIKTVSAEKCSDCSPILNDAAVEAVKKWEYQPTMVDGNPVSIRSAVIFRFQLDKEPAVEVLTRSEDTDPSKPLPAHTLEPGGYVIGSIIAAPPPSGTAAVPKTLELSASIAESHLIYKVNPEYPQMARIAHIQGDVVVQCVIDKSGNINKLQSISGHPILVQSALDAVKKWKYTPFLVNGNPVEVRSTITVRFRM